MTYNSMSRKVSGNNGNIIQYRTLVEVKRIYDYLLTSETGENISNIAKNIKSCRCIAQVKPKLAILLYLGVLEKIKSNNGGYVYKIKNGLQKL